MNESLEQGYNISKMLDSCQLSNLGFFKDTLLVIVSPFASLRVNSGKNLKAILETGGVSIRLAPLIHELPLLFPSV